MFREPPEAGWTEMSHPPSLLSPRSNCPFAGMSSSARLGDRISCGGIPGGWPLRPQQARTLRRANGWPRARATLMRQAAHREHRTHHLALVRRCRYVALAVWTDARRSIRAASSCRQVMRRACRPRGHVTTNRIAKPVNNVHPERSGAILSALHKRLQHPYKRVEIGQRARGQTTKAGT